MHQTIDKSRAIFLNNLVEAQLLAADGGCGDKDIVIPIGPDARYYAEKKCWKIQLIRDFFSEGSHEEGRIVAEEIVHRVAAKINEYYKQDDKFPPIPMGDYFLFDLFVIIGQILFTRHLLEIVSNSYSIRVFQNQSLADKSILGIRPHPDALISQVAHGIKQENCDTILYHADNTSAPVPLKRKLRNVLPARVVDILYQSKWYKEKMKSPLSWRKKKKNLLVLGGMFDWKPIVFSPEFMAEYVPTFKSLGTYPNDIRSARSVQALCTLISETVFPERPNAFDFSNLARRIHAVAEVLREQYGRLNQLVRKHDAVLASVFVTPFQHVIAHCAIKHHKPVICYQHGEMNLYPEVVSGGFIEILNTTHYFAYGEGVTSKYTSFIERSHLKEVIVVGTTLKKPIYRGGKLVIYATGKWFKTARPYCHYPDPDARLYEAQRDIIAYLEQYAKRNPADRIIIKANNTDLFNSIPFNTDIKIDYTSRFTDILQDAKLVILDTPATTCIEAASTSVPLFVLSGRARWYDEPMRLLKKRAIVEDRADRLLAHVERFEKDGTYPAELSSREFADSYGGRFNAVQSLERVMESLRKIVHA